MNENNLFDDNQNTNPFEQQTPNEIPAVEENVVKEEQPVEIPVQETPAVDLGINVLNNVGANAPDVKQQVKKSVSKTPFIIIAAVLLLSLFVGGGGYAVKTLVFDKAPNKVEMPEGDESHMIEEEKEDEQEEIEEEFEEEIGEGSESETGEGSTTKPEQGETSSSGGQSGQSTSTLESTVKKEEKTQTKFSVENIETDGSETIGIYLNNDLVLYEITKSSNDIVIYKKEAVDADIEKGTSVEIYRRSFEPRTVIADDGTTYLSSFIAYGSFTNTHLLLKIDMEGVGTFLIFDENLNVLQEGYYDEETQPYMTDEAIYYPTIECGNKNKYKINKLNIETGSITTIKTNDYSDNSLYCQ